MDHLIKQTIKIYPKNLKLKERRKEKKKKNLRNKDGNWNKGW